MVWNDCTERVGTMSIRWLLGVVVIVAVGAVIAVLPAVAQPGVGPGWWSGPRGGASGALSIAQAEEIARQAIARSGIQGVVPVHIMEFSNNFYVAIKDK